MKNMKMEQGMEIDPRREQQKLFKIRAEEVLGDQYDGAEISEVIFCFEIEDLEKWSDRISELSEIISDDENELSSEEIVIWRAKFIGEMRMYSYLNGDRRDAKKYRESKG